MPQCATNVVLIPDVHCGVEMSNIHLSVVELMRFQKTKKVLSKVKRKKSPYPTLLVGARKLRLCFL